MSDEAAALISRLADINFEFVKGTGRWPSGKEISPPNLELIRECGRQAEKHANELILELEEVMQQRDGLLGEVQALREALTEVTDDLAFEIIDKYGPIRAHPDTVRSFDRDMEPVRRAWKLLAGGETGEAE